MNYFQFSAMYVGEFRRRYTDRSHHQLTNKMEELRAKMLAQRKKTVNLTDTDSQYHQFAEHLLNKLKTPAGIRKVWVDMSKWLDNCTDSLTPALVASYRTSYYLGK